MAERGLLVFDMDGVLVDVSESYREAIRATVHHFTGREVSHDLIQQYKNAGGWNNDWALSHKIINDLGVQAEYHAVVDYFQHIFFGSNHDGFMRREKWLPAPGLLGRLQQRFALAIFTGRLRSEVEITLHRFVPDFHFDMIVPDDEVPNPKPAPDGLLLIRSRLKGDPAWYVGDTVDDARSSRAAGIPFIGIASPSSPSPQELSELLKKEGAVHVLANINEIESVLCAAPR
jgi:HAD superfamily phosphatase